MDLETKVERLEEEATDRWGERWTIEVSRYADGDFNAYAVQHYGRNDDGHLMQDRIYIAEDGEVIISRRTIDQQEIESKLLESPESD